MQRLSRGSLAGSSGRTMLLTQALAEVAASTAIFDFPTKQIVSGRLQSQVPNQANEPKRRVMLIDRSRLKTWVYVMPLMCWLLYGRQIRGVVKGRTKSEARAALKVKLHTNALPDNLLLEEVEARSLFEEA